MSSHEIENHISSHPWIPEKKPKEESGDGSSTTSSSAPVKVATPEAVALNNKTSEVDSMQWLLFEDIGGQELINIARNDTINGQNVIYQPIKNLSDIAIQYNPQNILSSQNTIKNYFDNFPIKIEEKLPLIINNSLSYTVPTEQDANGQYPYVVYYDLVEYYIFYIRQDNTLEGAGRYLIYDFLGNSYMYMPTLPEAQSEILIIIEQYFKQWSMIYLEEGTGDLIINLTNLEVDEEVQVEILASGTQTFS